MAYGGRGPRPATVGLWARGTIAQQPSRPPLIRYQARTNPFKIMMRMPVTAASAKQEKREEEGEIPSRVYRRAEEGTCARALVHDCGATEALGGLCRDASQRLAVVLVVGSMMHIRRSSSIIGSPACAHRLRALAITVGLLAAPASAGYYDYKGAPPSQPCIMYEVRPGDYCYKIAVVNGISYRQFLSQNPGIDCTRLRAGQSLCLIPLSLSGGWRNGWHADVAGDLLNSKASEVAPCKAYAVQEGDVCGQIAEDNGISVDKLVEINQEAPLWNGCNNLSIGQTICVA
ncbi:hypothetical protein GGI20_004961 [Coemansia sp. BCRC 34301]|nr:hypothetical protein GGI20_004961 [Coemansia sp. BCRC 34301]